MLDLQEFCRAYGEERTFDLDWMEGAAGVRLTVLRAREV
jgi:DNA replication ATP-dependent helicase Dna2